MFSTLSPMRRLRFFTAIYAISTVVLLITWLGRSGYAADSTIAKRAAELLDRKNLVAWCIVPFDDRERTPRERAEMLQRLGLGRLAYDYRAQHIASFDEELDQLAAHQIELTAWWFPTELNDEARLILQTLKRHQLTTQLWVTGGGEPTKTAAEQMARVQAEAHRIRLIAEAAAEIGCKVSLYNHGGWFGDPDNQLAILHELNMPNVGIVYNLHHGHRQLSQFSEMLAGIKPYLHCINLNGMFADGDRHDLKIVPVGAGPLDKELLTKILDSGYVGPIGILNHTQHNAEQRLQDNLSGLEAVVASIASGMPVDMPQWRTWDKPASLSTVSSTEHYGLLKSLLEQARSARLDGSAAEWENFTASAQRVQAVIAATATNPRADEASVAISTIMKRLLPDLVATGQIQPAVHEAEYEILLKRIETTLHQHVNLPVSGKCGEAPFTVRLDLQVSPSDDYNVLLAFDSKASNQHWELFTHPKSGALSLYRPGQIPNHIHTNVALCDGKRHIVLLQLDKESCRISVDGNESASAPIQKQPDTGADCLLGIGQLVDGSLATRGEVFDVKIADGILDDETLSSAGESIHLAFRWEAVAATATGVARSPANSVAVARDAEKIEQDAKLGDVSRGAAVFASHQTACISCHMIGITGGRIGPELTRIAADRKVPQLIDSILYPRKEVLPAFVAQQFLLTSGLTITGYVKSESPDGLILVNPATREERSIKSGDIEDRQTVGSLMPEGPTAALTDQQLADLVAFTANLDGRGETAAYEAVLAKGMAHAHGAVRFSYQKEPIEPAKWQFANHAVNRDRVYDFYAKEAEFFRGHSPVPPLLMEYPGLDGGALGHWGNQNESTWANGSWNRTDLGSLQCGIFKQGGKTIARAVCLRPGDRDSKNFCYDTEKKEFVAEWKGDFLKFSSVRHGFMDGIEPAGQLEQLSVETTGALPDSSVYRGYYRSGKRTVFAYECDGIIYLDSLQADGRVAKRVIAPLAGHPDEAVVQGGAPQWPETIETPIELGLQEPYAIDTIELPRNNPWKSLLFCSAHAFLRDGSALVCTMQGDVWRVDQLTYPSRTARWKRFATGLCQPLGIVSDDDGIFVLGRDQLTRLHDSNHDNEADYYECFSTAYVTSTAGHDFLCGLERGPAGEFYFASGNQGLMRISSDGKTATVIGTGLRNPDGVGVFPDGTVTVPVSEGEWTPATQIFATRPAQIEAILSGDAEAVPHFGYRGPKNHVPPTLPFVYLPRGVDNSAGGQTIVEGDKWGPLTGQMLHFSFGTGQHFLLLRDEVDGQLQGAIVPLDGDFRSGAHRGRFNPADGQLYVTGMQGWGTYTPEEGCFQRVRYTGKPVDQPIGFRVHANGVAITFSRPVNQAIASNAASHLAQSWNYRYSGAYGSAEYSPSQYGVRGHDVLAIKQAHVTEDGRTLFLEMPELRLCNQLHLHVAINSDVYRDLFLTVNRLAEPFAQLPNYVPQKKFVEPHPLFRDIVIAAKTKPSRWAKSLPNAREITLETAANLSFATRTLHAKPGETIKLILKNPDVVPHNWALTAPGTLKEVGMQADRFIADPDAFSLHYIPPTPHVLAHTEIVWPGESSTIYFNLPDTPGRYPFLCTFPGHWLAMNGELIVE